MITDLKTYVNYVRIKVGDILYKGDPTNVIRPSFRIVLFKSPLLSDYQLMVLLDISERRTLLINKKSLDELIGYKIYKIENIEDENIKYILDVFINDHDIYYNLRRDLQEHFKKEVKQTLDSWIKRYPKVKEFLEEIEMKKDSEKYNL